MSIVAMFMALLLVVSLHACNARRTPPGLGIHKNAANGKIKVEHEVDIKSFIASEDTKETFSGDTSMSMTMFDEVQSTFQIQGLGRNVRSMAENETRDETKEPSDANDEEPVEDAVVMDYVTPHRKAPIHNQHHDVDRP